MLRAEKLANLTHAFDAARELLMQNQPLRGWRQEGIAAPPVSASEAKALKKAGFSLQPVDDDERDPQTRGVVDFMALMDSSLSVADVAKLLGVDSSRIRQRLKDRSLMGVQSRGQWRLPLFQFAQNKTLPGLERVLPHAPEDLAPPDLVEWFLKPNADLEIEPRNEGAPRSLSPRTWLLQGRDHGLVASLLRDI